MKCPYDCWYNCGYLLVRESGLADQDHKLGQAQCHCWLMGDSSRLSSTTQVSHGTALLTTKWSRWRKPLFRGRCTWSTGSDPCHPWRRGHQHSFCLRVWVTPTNEVIHHGAYLGLGLAALGTADEEIYEDTKGVLYTENTNLFINIMITWYIAKRA